MYESGMRGHRIALYVNIGQYTGNLTGLSLSLSRIQSNLHLHLFVYSCSSILSLILGSHSDTTIITMPDASAFLRKKKDKKRIPSAAHPGPAGASATANGLPNNVASRAASGSTPRATPAQRAPSAASAAPPSDPSKIIEIKLFSGDFAPASSRRHNLMRLNSTQHEVDITSIPGPILLNRKDPAFDQSTRTMVYGEDGKIMGKYVFDHEGKPLLDASGKQVIEVKDKADRSLIGGSEKPKRARKKGIKEVYHQDREVMRLRREEQVPWVLESGSVSRAQAQAAGSGKTPVHWIGHYQEPTPLPTVLFVNNGNEPGFRVVPLGRTYRFEPDRPFKQLDLDEANKMVSNRKKQTRVLMG